VLSVTFPHLASVVVEQVLVDDGGVALTARTVTREAACPGCGTLSGRVHGGYRRRLADLAVGGRKVVIDLAVRRFLCQAAPCARRTFVEQIAGLTERFARRPPALRRTLERIALALAGTSGGPAGRASVGLRQCELADQDGAQAPGQTVLSRPASDGCG
jgi:DNA-directed RNA polymerase subunit N (RpoN/RPB10)